MLPHLETRRLVLIVPRESDAERLLAYARENESHLGPWEPARPHDFFTLEYWQHATQGFEREFALGESVRFLFLDRANPNGRIIARANFTHIARGPFQACSLGYSIDRRDEGKGLMHEGLQAAIRYVFAELGLHRIMANYIPTNERSGRLLRRLGFVVEGYAREYLFINGFWRDHVLTALINPKITTC